MGFVCVGLADLDARAVGVCVDLVDERQLNLIPAVVPDDSSFY